MKEIRFLYAYIYILDTLQAKADQYSYSEPPSKSYLIDDFFFTHFNPVVPEDTDGADVSASNNSLWMLQDYLDVYQTVPLLTQQDSDESSSEQIIRDNSSLVISLNTTTIMCHQDFCCDFKVNTIVFSFIVEAFCFLWMFVDKYCVLTKKISCERWHISQ